MAKVTDSISVLDALQDGRLQQYLQVSAGVLLIWDWITHLDNEISLVWSRDWISLGTPIYLILRYGGIAVQVFDIIATLGVWDSEFCKIYLHVVTVSSALFLYLVDVVLVYRVSCLYYDQSRWVGIGNTVLLSCSVITSILMVVLGIPRAGDFATPMHCTGCWSIRLTLDRAVIAPLLAFESWMVLLVAYKVYTAYKECSALRTRAMFKLLVQDQTYWFVIITAVLVWATIHDKFTRPTLHLVPAMYLRLAPCICGCQLILHIRQSYSSDEHSGDITLASVMFRKLTRAPQSCTLGQVESSMPVPLVNVTSSGGGTRTVTFASETEDISTFEPGGTIK